MRETRVDDPIVTEDLRVGGRTRTRGHVSPSGRHPAFAPLSHFLALLLRRLKDKPATRVRTMSAASTVCCRFQSERRWWLVQFSGPFLTLYELRELVKKHRLHSRTDTLDMFDLSTKARLDDNDHLLPHTHVILKRRPPRHEPLVSRHVTWTCEAAP